MASCENSTYYELNQVKYHQRQDHRANRCSREEYARPRNTRCQALLRSAEDQDDLVLSGKAHAPCGRMSNQENGKQQRNRDRYNQGEAPDGDTPPQAFDNGCAECLRLFHRAEQMEGLAPIVGVYADAKTSLKGLLFDGLACVSGDEIHDETQAALVA